jgi:1-acyl-sn-glycerol-3-phosphate acyltransferase
MIGWGAQCEVDLDRPTPVGWLPVILKFILCALVIGLLLAPLIVLRAFGLWRAGQRVVQLACWLCLKVIGLRLTVKGTRMQHAGVVVANHSSWLDILTLNASQRVFFVAKAEVRSRPAIGAMAYAVGTVFIRRKRGDAKLQHDLFLDHAKKGHKLLFFPEGTSTDGCHVLPFRSSLFQAFFAPDLADLMWAQPVTVLYYAPDGKRADFYGYWGEMEMFEHMIHVLSQARQGRVEVVFHDPLKIGDFPDRKALAQAAFHAVAGGMPFRLPN